MDVSQTHRLIAIRFRHRASACGDGSVLFDPGDGAGRIRLDAGEWERLSSWFDEAMLPYGRSLRWCLILHVPLSILTLAIVPAKAIDLLMGDFVVIAMLVVMTWPAMLGLFLHWRGARRTLDMIARHLGDRERVPGRVQPWRKLSHIIEIAAMVLIGPHLLIAAFGTFQPEAFDNTPWTDVRLGMFELVGLAILLLVVTRNFRRRARR